MFQILTETDAAGGPLRVTEVRPGEGGGKGRRREEMTEQEAVGGRGTDDVWIPLRQPLARCWILDTGITDHG